MASAVLAMAIVLATLASRQAAHVDRRSHATHGCQAAGPGGVVATFEAADVAASVHQVASAPGPSSGGAAAMTPSAHGRSIRSAFTFARPYDPLYLHTFSLLI
jgi:hypothetical protein